MRVEANWLQCLRELDAVFEQAEVAFCEGRQAVYMTALDAHTESIGVIGDPWRAALWQCWEGFLRVVTQGYPEHAMAYCHKALALAEGKDLSYLRAFAECCAAQIHLIAGDLLAGQLAGIRALVTFEIRGNIPWACRALWLLSALTNAMERWEDSVAYCRRALAHAQEGAHARLTVVSTWRIGSTLILSGHPAEGILWCEAALTHSPAPLDRMTIEAVRGNGLIRCGHLDEGITQLEAATAWFKERLLWHDYSVFGLHLGEGYVQRGKRVFAKTLFEEIVRVSYDRGYGRLEKKAKKSLDAIEKE